MVSMNTMTDWSDRVIAPKDSKLETSDRSESELGSMRVLGGLLIEVA
jgi:hypothetical protein